MKIVITIMTGMRHFDEDLFPNTNKNDALLHLSLTLIEFRELDAQSIIRGSIRGFGDVSTQAHSSDILDL